MKIKICLPFLILLCSTLLVQAQSTTPYSTNPTTLILIRHAEKVEDGTRDPALSPEGKARAETLASLMLADYNVQAIYSTNYRRTKLTATPLADSLDLTLMTYGWDDPNTLLNDIIRKHRGEVVLIVGHSNTTPVLVNLLLGEEKYEQLGENEYGSLFVVMVTKMGDAKVQKITY